MPQLLREETQDINLKEILTDACNQIIWELRSEEKIVGVEEFIVRVRTRISQVFPEIHMSCYENFPKIPWIQSKNNLFQLLSQLWITTPIALKVIDIRTLKKTK